MGKNLADLQGASAMGMQGRLLLQKGGAGRACQEAGTATTDGRRRNRAGTRSDNGPTEEKAELARIRCRMGTVKGRGPCNWLRKQHIKTGW
jgi:hypothetical protein